MRKRTTRVPPEVRVAIEELAEQYRMQHLTPNAAEIRRKLEKRFGAADVPTERTIRNIAGHPRVGEVRAWSAARSTVDVSLVLPTLARLVEATAGGRKQLTVDEAEMVAMIRAGAPGLDPLRAYAVATDYLRAMRDNDDARLADLDLLLALDPWASDEAMARYERVVDSGWTQPPLVWIVWKAQHTVEEVGRDLAQADKLDDQIIERRRTGASSRTVARELGVTTKRVQHAEEWRRKETEGGKARKR